MDKIPPKHDDPDYLTFCQFTEWSNKVECIPSWEEILEYEYVRSHGEINMITDNVQRYAFDRGMYHLVVWYQRCIENRLSAPFEFYSIAVEHYSREHGPVEKWITKEFKRDMLKKELQAKEYELKRQLEELRVKIDVESTPAYTQGCVEDAALFEPTGCLVDDDH